MGFPPLCGLPSDSDRVRKNRLYKLKIEQLRAEIKNLSREYCLKEDYIIWDIKFLPLNGDVLQTDITKQLPLKENYEGE
jgi:hypothetical protein